MLENSTPDYNKEHIISIITHLYKIQDLKIKGLTDSELLTCLMQIN